jgi:hypothetical protein
MRIADSGRIAFQPKTRRELGGPFLGDYARSVKWPQTWDDGDEWFVNYVGHPLHGGAAGRTWLNNDPTARTLELSLSKPYWASRAKAARWSALYSLQFEFGPLSEASIGNAGYDPRGWITSSHRSGPLASSWQRTPSTSTLCNWSSAIQGIASCEARCVCC